MTTTLPVSLTWDPRLPLDLAINQSPGATDPMYSDSDILARYGLNQDELNALRSSETFQEAVRLAVLDFDENGANLARKARAMFEFYMDNAVPEIMSNGRVDPKVKKDLLEFLAKVAKVDTKSAPEGSTALPGGAIAPSLNITLQVSQPPSAPEPRIISEQ